MVTSIVLTTVAKYIPTFLIRFKEWQRALHLLRFLDRRGGPLAPGRIAVTSAISACGAAEKWLGASWETGDRRKLTEREEQESEEMGIHHFQVIREKKLKNKSVTLFQDTHEKCIDLFLCSLAQKSATQKQCIHHYVLIFEWCQVILDLKPRFQSFPVSPNIISPWLYHTQTIVCHLSRYIHIYIYGLRVQVLLRDDILLIHIYQLPDQSYTDTFLHL